MKEKVMQGKPYAGNPHVRFGEGAGAPRHSGRSALLYKRIILFLAVAMAATTLFAEPTVTAVTAKLRYPWNGLVDITCKMTGTDEATDVKFDVSTVKTDSGNVNKISNFWVVQNGTNSTDRKVHVNGDHRLLWDAKTDLGTGLHSNIAVRVTAVDVHSKIQLWDGGPYWADRNIGAEKPEDYGYYFWWGDTTGHTPSFNFDNRNSVIYTTGKSVSELRNAGWLTSDSVLVPEHDAAHVYWGGNWRMPTGQELSDLNYKCDWTWTTTNGVAGYVVRGKGDYSSASIFLPAVGYGGGGTAISGPSLHYAGWSGYYWSSVPCSSDYDFMNNRAWGLNFTSSSRRTDGEYRFHGLTIRPVQGDTEQQQVWTVTFNPMDGAVEETERTVTNGCAVGELPVPAREGYSFRGWFTLADVGDRASSETVVTSDVTFYAHWTAWSSNGPWGEDPEIGGEDTATLPPTYLVSVSLSVFGNSAPEGTCIAGFDSDGVMRAYGVVEPNGNLDIRVSAPEGSRIHWKVWVAGSPLDEIHEAKGDSYVFQKPGYDYGGYAIEVGGSDFIEQTLTIQRAGWNLVSFNVMPDDPSPEAVFAAVADSVQSVVSGTRRWTPQSGGRLAALQIGVGYWVKTTRDNVVWTISGKSDESVEIRVNEGWNLIGYPLLGAGAPEAVLKGASEAGIVSSVVSGTRRWTPQSGGRLTEMTPGVGYWLKAAKSGTVKFDK